MAKRVFPLDVDAFDTAKRVRALEKDYQRYWYLRLCVAGYLNKERPGCVPDNPCELWKLAGVTAAPPRSLTLNPMRRMELEFAQVLACFVPTGDGWLRHERVFRDAEQQQATSDARSRAARKRHANAEQLQKPEGVFVFALDDPEEIKNCFERAYRSYPIHRSKETAWKYFQRHITKLEHTKKQSAGQCAEWLELRITQYGQSAYVAQMLAEGNKRKLPYLGTWLNAGNYEDDPDEWNTAGQLKTSPEEAKQRAIAAVVGPDADAD